MKMYFYYLNSQKKMQEAQRREVPQAERLESPFLIRAFKAIKKSMKDFIGKEKMLEKPEEMTAAEMEAYFAKYIPVHEDNQKLF